MVILRSNSFIACFGALVPNFIAGTSLTVGLMGSFFLLSSYFIAKEDIHNYWIFMHYFSLFKYPFECFMINGYSGKQSMSRCLETMEGQCLLYSGTFLEQRGLKHHKSGAT